MVLVFSDVSEQYRLQRVVIESENRYRVLVESSPVGVVVQEARGRVQLPRLRPPGAPTAPASGPASKAAPRVP